ncbi:MAG: metallophosphoesterase family protein, partial [Kiritimatiellaeota bacterium]|nr:metallophosphoesterase family protein [Kiritimatiellota bacterium]
NWQAWYAVREDLRTQLADVVICLGDVVGYGPHPQGVLKDVRQCCDSVLMGNHEAAAIGQLDLEIFNPVARRAAEWTATQLDEEEKSYLGQLPLVLEDGDLLFVHAEPVAPDEWGYVETAADAQVCFQATDKRMMFVGHTHLPEVFTLRPDGQVTQTQPVELTLEAGARYLVNVGSVGEPRDGS